MKDVDGATDIRGKTIRVAWTEGPTRGSCSAGRSAAGGRGGLTHSPVACTSEVSSAGSPLYAALEEKHWTEVTQAEQADLRRAAGLDDPR